MHEIADSVEPEDAEQPYDEQSERNLQQHLASGTQPAPRTIGQLLMDGVARLPATLIAGRMEAKAGVGRDEMRATPQTSSGRPVTAYGWDSAETREGPTCGRSANRACQLASSWSRNDREDGGPTIQLPAADARCTLRSLSCLQYMRLKRDSRRREARSSDVEALIQVLNIPQPVDLFRPR
jgi:hypothetical protein